MTLIIFIISISAVTAADNTTDNIISESSTNTQIEQNTIKNSEPIIKNTTKTKEINKQTNKNTKTATKTVTVNNYDELTTTINNAVQDAENDEYELT